MFKADYTDSIALNRIVTAGHCMAGSWLNVTAWQQSHRYGSSEAASLAVLADCRTFFRMPSGAFLVSSKVTTVVYKTNLVYHSNI